MNVIISCRVFLFCNLFCGLIVLITSFAMHSVLAEPDLDNERPWANSFSRLPLHGDQRLDSSSNKNGLRGRCSRKSSSLIVTRSLISPWL